jgi:hypothetical protein
MKRVYVIYDPLFEKVVCVHDSPNMECKKCKAASKDKDGYQRGTYQLEEKRFNVQMKDRTILLKEYEFQIHSLSGTVHAKNMTDAVCNAIRIYAEAMPYFEGNITRLDVLVKKVKTTKNKTK